MIKKNWNKPVLRTTLIYAVFGILWIIFSDRLIITLVQDYKVITEIQTFKGWFFVLITTIILYRLIAHDFKIIENSRESLKDSEERYRSIFENNSAIKLLVDAVNGNIVNVNIAACRYFDISKDDILQQNISDLFDSDISSMNHIIRNEKISPLLLKIKCNLNPIRYAEAYPGILKIQSNEFLYLIIHDVTEKRIIEQELEEHRNELERIIEERTQKLKKTQDDLIKALEKEKELNQLKSRFLSVASHEFRTPLTTILASADLLELFGKNWTDEKKLEHTKKIRRTVKMMVELLDDVLTMSRTETGKIDFNPAPMNLYELCNEVFESIKPKNNDKYTFAYNYNLPSPQVILDEKLLRQILSNLLTNAVKYSPEGGEIKFSVDKSDNLIRFSVCDNGIGISGDDIKFLFEPFHRGENIGSIPGTGLGLSIVKKSVELHNGSITVESEVNKGTIFNIYIPQS